MLAALKYDGRGFKNLRWGGRDSIMGKSTKKYRGVWVGKVLRAMQRAENLH